MTAAGQRTWGGRPRRRDERRDWVADRLAALGLGRRPARPQPPMAGMEPASVRLAAALPSLGPVFCAFGRYLAGRADLLPEAACQALATVSDAVPPMPHDRVREMLASELVQRHAVSGIPGSGAPPLGHALFAALDPVPLRSTFLWQEHRGRLPGGERVVVRLVRPELEAEMGSDLEALPLLGPALAAAGGDARGLPRWLGAAIDDFAGAVAAAADLSRQAAALAALGEDAAASGLALAAPRVLPELSGQRVMTVEELPGTAVVDFLRGHPEPRAAAETATRWCQAWLRQACFGQVFPVELQAGDLRVQADGRLLWTADAFAALPAASKGNLWTYLLAAAADDPDRACDALLRELEGGPAGGAGALRHRLRQLVPFRDGGPGARDDLAGYLFLHWRCAAEAGYQPRSELVAFYRGLARLAAAVRPLAPQCDALREGLDAARLTAGMGELTRLLAPAQVKEILGSYAAALLAMPQRLNELMNLAAAGRVNVKVEVVEPAGERRRKDSTAVYLAVLMAMAAVVLFDHQLASAGVLGPWVERGAAALLGLLGAFLLLGGHGRGGGKREP